LREACMTKGKNIAKQSELFETASLLENEFQFDMDLFKQNFFGAEGREAFRKDLQEVKYYGINRFPSLVIKNQSGNAKLLTGYNTYETVAEILNGFLLRVYSANKSTT
ncbi:MAG TPA: DsbA family protein, partial [Parafilimonas sp.]